MAEEEKNVEATGDPSPEGDVESAAETTSDAPDARGEGTEQEQAPTGDAGASEGGSRVKRTAVGAAVGAALGGAAVAGRDALSGSRVEGAKEGLRQSGEKVKGAAGKVGGEAKRRLPGRRGEPAEADQAEESTESEGRAEQ